MQSRSLSSPDADRKGKPGAATLDAGNGGCETCTPGGGILPDFLPFRGVIGAFFAPVRGRRPTLPFPVKMFAYWALGFGNIRGHLGKCLLGLRLIRSHSRANGLIRAPGSMDVGRTSGILRCRHIAGDRSHFVTDRKSKEKAAIANS